MPNRASLRNLIVSTGHCHNKTGLGQLKENLINATSYQDKFVATVLGKSSFMGVIVEMSTYLWPRGVLYQDCF